MEPVRYVEKLEIDDVRVLLNKNQFEKKHIQTWSSKVYNVIKKIGLGYEISDGSGKKYFISELLKVNKNSKSSADNVNEKVTNLIIN